MCVCVHIIPQEQGQLQVSSRLPEGSSRTYTSVHIHTFLEQFIPFYHGCTLSALGRISWEFEIGQQWRLRSPSCFMLALTVCARGKTV